MILNYTGEVYDIRYLQTQVNQSKKRGCSSAVVFCSGIFAPILV